MIRSFTGPSKLTVSQIDWVAEDVATLSAADEERSGAAHGVDSIVAAVRLVHSPLARHVLYVPAAPHNGALVEAWEYDIEWPRPERRRYVEAYRTRNEAMVARSDLLVAYLFKPVFYRSGEWMTVNAAHRFGVKVDMRIIPEAREEQ